MQNKSFLRFNLFSFLARRANPRVKSVGRPAANKSRRLTLETLEDRALLSISTGFYGPIYEDAAVLETAENRTAVGASEFSDETDESTLQTDVNLEVKTSTFNDGQVLSLTLRASTPIAVWQIDWGDGSAPDVCEKLSDSLIVAHTYELQKTEREYVVVATLTEPDGASDEDGYCVAFHTTHAKACSSGTFVTTDSTTTFLTDEFYDAEKSSSSNSNLCWAAGSANALYYAGWAISESLVDASGRSEAFESEDDVYSYFTENFDNSGSSVLYAFEWFITGEYKGENLTGWAQCEDDSGGFYTDVNIDDVVEYYSYRSNATPKTIMQTATEELEQGWAICASLGFYTSTPKGRLRLAHTLTVWGYVCDENYSSDDPNYYTALIVSDPDDSKYRGRDAENQLVTISLEWSDTYNRYQTDYQTSGYSVWLEELITLAPRDSVDATQRTAETPEEFLPLDAQRRAEENCFELLEELNDQGEDW